MKKVILRLVALFAGVISMFALGAMPVSAGFIDGQKDAGPAGVPMGSDPTPSEGFIISIQRGLNWLLGILAIVTLFVLVYGGILMITAAGDEEKYKKGFTMLKQASVGLIFIGLAWMFIMLVFFVIKQMAGV